MFFLRDQRRREGDRVARHAHHHVLVMEGNAHCVEAALARQPLDGRKVERRHESDGADVLQQRMALEAHRGRCHFRLHLFRAFEQALVAIEVERRKRRRGGERMAGIGIAVKEVDHMIGSRLERVVDMLAHHAAAHRHRARCDALREGENVRRHAEAFRRRRVAEPSEAGDHLVENEQDAMLVAKLAQALEIAFGRRQYTGRTCHRLDDHGGDG